MRRLLTIQAESARVQAESAAAILALQDQIDLEIGKQYAGSLSATAPLQAGNGNGTADDGIAASQSLRSLPAPEANPTLRKGWDPSPLHLRPPQKLTRR